MSPVMEVLDRHPTPAPTESPDRTPHLDIRGGSPSCRSEPQECPAPTPPRTESPPANSPPRTDHRTPDSANEEEKDTSLSEAGAAVDETVPSEGRDGSLDDCNLSKEASEDSPPLGEQTDLVGANQGTEDSGGSRPPSDYSSRDESQKKVYQRLPPFEDPRCASYSVHPGVLDPRSLEDGECQRRYDDEGSSESLDRLNQNDSVPLNPGDPLHIGDPSHLQRAVDSDSRLSAGDLEQRTMVDGSHRNQMDGHHLHMQHLHHHLQLHNPYSEQQQQQCHLQDYRHHPILKHQLHLQGGSHLPDHLHDYEELGEHSQLQSLPERSVEGYWNMHLGMLSKVKAESKEWYDGEGVLSDIKNADQHDVYNAYRLSSHQNLGSESPQNHSLNGPRPSPIPQGGGLNFSQSPDQRQQAHYQTYQNLPSMRDMGPLSPGYQEDPRNHMQGSQFHGASQHPHLQHPQQQYGGHQHYPGQQQMNMQRHPMASPYPPGMMGPGIGGHEGREGREGDPYSFVDEYSGPPPRPVEEILGHTQPKRRGRKPKHIKLMENGGDPLAIAAAQAAHEAKKRKWRQMGPDGKPVPLPIKPRKRIDRFDGLSEDELSKKILPDHLGPELDIVIIGINPGLFAAYKGHHYAGPGNHFWKCLYLSGLIPEPLTSDDDHHLLDHGIGFTNIVARTTRGSAELTRKEIKEGGQILLSKLQRYQPRVAVFNGKGIYEIFSGKKEFTFGRQPEKIEGTSTHVWVMPSSSARCAQLPRALDKVPFYTALRKFRDFLKGTITELTEEEITFTCPKTKQMKVECDKLEGGSLDDDLSDSYLDDPLRDDLDSSRFESDLDSEEISRSISQSLYNLSGMTREQLEALDCPTIPIRKKRGRPKKTPDDPNAPPRPKPRTTFPTELLLCNGEEPPRKKRGRPKKILEDGTTPQPKRPGRKSKAMKEMLAGQPGSIVAGAIHQSPHSQISMGHLNGMMSPGYSTNAGIPHFSPQYGGSQGHGHPGGCPPDRLTSLQGMNSHQGLPLDHSSLHGSLHSGPNLPSLHSGNHSLHSSGCPTPGSNGGAHPPLHNALPPRGHTPQAYGQSPAYSASPVSNPHHHQVSYSSSDKSDLQCEEERQLGLSPIPASPVMAQPDFEPPTSLPESEPLIGSNDPNRSISSGHQEESQMGRQRTSSIQSQFSNPSTPADESTTSYPNYPSYPPTTSCSPSYNANVSHSPSYGPPPVSHSPSYPTNVSCSPSYATSNPNITHSPSYHSPSYPPTSTQSPSYPPNSNHSPSYPQPSNQSPSFTPVTQSPSYQGHSSSTTQSPSYHTNINQSPSYSTITRSPSYPPNPTQSPSYRPSTAQSPSFSSAPTQSPSLNKPLAPGVHSPQMSKGDVSSKSLSGLESLVDQIPSLNDSESGSHSSLQNGPCSNPTTPCPTATDPFSPGHSSQGGSSFQSFTGGGPSFSSTHYGSPQTANPYSPQYSSSSTNLSTNFSVSSLASSSITTSLSYEGVNDVSTTTTSSSSNTPVISSSSASFSVSSLTGESPTQVSSMYSGNSYSPSPSGPSPHSYAEIMGSPILPPTPSMGHSFMGSSGMPPSMGGLHSSMNMAGSQLPYPYNQYADSGPGSYNGPGHSFPYSPPPAGFHVPSPRFPYPSPYSSGPYAQGYSQNAMLERIKHTGMGMGFGGF